MKKLLALCSLFFAFSSQASLSAGLENLETHCRHHRCHPCHRHHHHHHSSSSSSSSSDHCAEICCILSVYTNFDSTSDSDLGEVEPGDNVPLNLVQFNEDGFIPVVQGEGDAETVRAWEIPEHCAGVYQIVWGVSANNEVPDAAATATTAAIGPTNVALAINGVPLQSTQTFTGEDQQTTTYASIVVLRAGDVLSIQNVGYYNLWLGSEYDGDEENNNAFVVLMRVRRDFNP